MKKCKKYVNKYKVKVGYVKELKKRVFYLHWREEERGFMGD